MHDEELTSAALHAGKRRWLVIVGGNFVLLAVMLGIPWLRGHLRTRALLEAFAAYGACLYDGRAEDAPGLGMPPGHELRFATRVQRAAGFVARCDGALSELAPEPAIFILPALKVAEADLRAAVALVREQLGTLAVRTPGAPLSIKPLQAIERLRAGLANHALAAGSRAAPDAQAFRLSDAPSLPTPTRVPLATGAGASLALWGTDAELHALAIDRGGISYAQLRAGKLEQTRTPRPKLLEAAVPTSAPTTFVWAMPRARCDTRAGGCADKALGVAPIQLPVSAAPVPRWLGAHPRGRSDRGVLRTDQGVLIAAARSDGASELRAFTLALDAASAAGDMPPLAASSVSPTHGEGDALLLMAQGVAHMLMVHREADAVALGELVGAPGPAREHRAAARSAGSAQKIDEAPRPLASLAGEGTPWLVGCSDDARLGVAFGHAGALVLGTLRDGEFTASLPVSLPLRDVVDAQDAARDRVVPLCASGEHALAVVHDRRARLWLVACPARGGSCAVEPLALQVRTFSARMQAGRLIVAYAGDGEAAQIRVRSMVPSAPRDAEEQVPTICWSDARGLCGPPLLAEAGRRLLLAAREGTDLRVLESADGGQTWDELAGMSRYH